VTDPHVTDRILLRNMVFQGTHGVREEEQRIPQPFEIDVDLVVDLHRAGLDDDLAQTVDYGQVFDVCRQIVESTRFRLIEALAEAIASELLADFPLASEITVRVRKPEAPINGAFDWVGVEICRSRA
jgi:dihydroneopterin aldolase